MDYFLWSLFGSTVLYICLTTVLCWFYYCSFVVYFEINSVIAAILFFLFKIALVIYSLLKFHINFIKFLKICEKVTHETVHLDPFSHFPTPYNHPLQQPLITTNLISEYMNWLLFYFLCLFAFFYFLYSTCGWNHTVFFFLYVA